MSTLMDNCFLGAGNIFEKPPKPEEITKETSATGSDLEKRAFSTLVREASAWGIKQVYQCKKARMDGYLVMKSGEVILLEIKTTLNWASITNATFQLLAGKKLLNLDSSTRGIIIFERWSPEWEKGPLGGREQFFRHAGEVAEHLSLGALMLVDDELKSV